MFFFECTSIKIRDDWYGALNEAVYQAAEKESRHLRAEKLYKESLRVKGYW